MHPSPAVSSRSAYVASYLLPLAFAAAFWVPSLDAGRGFFPAPLDDVYIHFDFARSLAEGHPFEWIPGNGYSSGETSPLYAVLLAAGWLVGFRGRLVGVWAAIIAIVSLAAFVRSVRAFVRPAPAVVTWGAALLTLSVALVDWTLFSGMEMAAFAGALGPTLLALKRARGSMAERGGLTREAAQWRLGIWGAVLVLLRPEAGVLVAVFAVVAARAVGRRSALAAIGRVALPAAVVTAAVIGANLIATGSAQSAGAQLKLLSSNPYLSPSDRARVYVENLVTFGVKGVRSELGAFPWLRLVVPGLAFVALLSRKRRSLVFACLAGALAWTLLVSWNSNSPFHNFRYYAPAMLLVLVAAGSGAAGIAESLDRRRKQGTSTACALLVCACGGALARLPAQVRHFTRAASNIRDQQIEVASRLAANTPGARLLLNDAGAIPFVSRLPAIDALGLGGYRRLPFALAAVHGEGATLELLERLDPAERPTHLAVYPQWFGAIATRFGVEVDRVTLADNLICAGPTKVIYRADWSPLDVPHPSPRGDVIDEIDVADVISEREHGYEAPLPEARATFDVLLDAQGMRRFDAGRTIPVRRSERFFVRNAGPGRARIVVRVDDAAGPIHMKTKKVEADLALSDVRPGGWREATAEIDALTTLDEIELTAKEAPYRDYHVWIVRP